MSASVAILGNHLFNVLGSPTGSCVASAGTRALPDVYSRGYALPVRCKQAFPYLVAVIVVEGTSISPAW